MIYDDNNPPHKPASLRDAGLAAPCLWWCWDVTSPCPQHCALWLCEDL